MAVEAELNTFIVKFKQLWKSGLTAHLDLDSSNGKAWVGLRLHLGDAPGPDHHSGGGHPVKTHDKSRNSPAKQRRRERRAALRENENIEVMEKVVKESAFEEKASDGEKEETADEVETEVRDSSAKEDSETIEIEEKVDDEIVVEVQNSSEIEGTETFENVNDLNNVNEIIETTEKAESVNVGCESGKDVEKSSNDAKESLNQPKVNDVTEVSDSGKETMSEVVEVFATANLDNSTRDRVFKDQIDSISQIIDYKEHLRRNIEGFKFGNISTWELSDKKFKHQIQVSLKVKTGQLWESARSYLWRHLGSSTWTLQDGTEFSLTRIHQR